MPVGGSDANGIYFPAFEEELESGAEGWKTGLNHNFTELSDLIDTVAGIATTTTLAAYTVATLPSPGTAGRLVRLTDYIRGVWIDTGTGWRSVTGKAHPMDFGADPTGATASDTAFANIIASIPYTGSTGIPAITIDMSDAEYQLTVPLYIKNKTVRFIGGGIGQPRGSGATPSKGTQSAVHWNGKSWHVISGVAVASGVVTITCTGHGFVTGERITVGAVTSTQSGAAAAESGVNCQAIITVDSSSVFHYTAPASMLGTSPTGGVCGPSVFIIEDGVGTSFEGFVVYPKNPTTYASSTLANAGTTGGPLDYFYFHSGPLSGFTNANNFLRGMSIGGYITSTPTTQGAPIVCGYAGVRWSGRNANNDQQHVIDTEIYNCQYGVSIEQTQTVWGLFTNCIFQNCWVTAFASASSTTLVNPTFNANAIDWRVNSSAHVQAIGYQSEGAGQMALLTQNGFLAVEGGHFLAGNAVPFPLGANLIDHQACGNAGGLALSKLFVDWGAVSHKKVKVRGIVNAGGPGSVSIIACPGIKSADLDIANAAGAFGMDVNLFSGNIRVATTLAAGATFVMRSIDNTVGGSGASGSSGTVFTSASVAPGDNRLLLLTVTSTPSGASADATVTGLGLTWVAVAHTADFGSTIKRTTVYRALGTVTPGTITMTWAGTQNGAQWTLSEVSGCVTTGTSGADAIVQAVANTAASGTTLTVTLAAFTNSNNATFGGFGIGGNSMSPQPGAGFSVIRSGDWATLGYNNTFLTEYQWANDTTVDVTWASTAGAGGIAIEIAMLATAIRPFA